jgi:hypothetical protein
MIGGVEYLDMSPYEYGSFPLPMRVVGWLGRRYGVPGGGAAPLVGAELARLRAACRRLGSRALGWHDCEFCSAFAGNGEYRFYLPDGEIYAAPMMILHYVEEHGYRPPRDLLDGLRTGARLRWDWRAERLRAVLLDEAADPDWRVEAAIDLPNWSNRWAFEALHHAAHDDELADVAGRRDRPLVGGVHRVGLREGSAHRGLSRDGRIRLPRAIDHRGSAAVTSPPT